MKNDKDKPAARFSVYSCLNCRTAKIVEQGNYHPYCMTCTYDQFDWTNGVKNVTYKDAKKIAREWSR